MTQAKLGDTVKVHYTGKLSDGTEFDSSVGGEPLVFTVGGGQVIPGFEEAVVGLNLGTSKTVVIVADQAYGPHHDEMVLDLEKKRFPNNITPVLGMELQVKRSDKQEVTVTVTEITETHITLDANHALAGKDLTFDIELVEIA